MFQAMKATNGYCSGHREAFRFFFPPFWCRVGGGKRLGYDCLSVPSSVLHSRTFPYRWESKQYTQKNEYRNKWTAFLTLSPSLLPHSRTGARKGTQHNRNKIRSPNTRAGGGVCGSRNEIMVEANVRMASADDCQLSGTWAMLGKASQPRIPGSTMFTHTHQRISVRFNCFGIFLPVPSSWTIHDQGRRSNKKGT